MRSFHPARAHEFHDREPVGVWLEHNRLATGTLNIFRFARADPALSDAFNLGFEIGRDDGRDGLAVNRLYQSIP